MFLGSSLRKLREAKKMSRATMARHSGISLSALSRLESTLSVPNIETLIRVANGLQVPLPRLLIEVGIVRKRCALRDAHIVGGDVKSRD